MQPFIFTFLLNLHGVVYNTEINSDIYKKCRLFSITAPDFGLTCERPNVEDMKKQLRKNIPGTFYELFSKSPLKPLASITFDKLLGATTGEMGEGFLISGGYGIFLVATHQPVDGTNKFRELPYWNLLKVADLKAFAETFNYQINSLGSEPINLPTNPTGFHIWSGIELSLDGKYIVKIKMSKFVEIIKSIVGDNAYINLLDFSCSPNASGNPARSWDMQIADVENMEGVEIWGGRSRGRSRGQRSRGQRSRGQRSKKATKQKRKKTYIKA